MRKSIKGTTKRKPGRPPTTGKGTQLGMRWHDAELSAIDSWAKAKGLVRSQAIRRLVELGLKPSISTDQSYQIKASESASKARKLAGELGLKAKAKS